MPGAASDSYTAWIADVIAPIARQHGFAGKGPTFRKRDGDVWTLFGLERRRKDPWEARTAAAEPIVDFRMMVGFAIPSLRPAWDTRKGPPGMHDCTLYAPTTVLEPPEGEFWHVFDPADESSVAHLTETVRRGLPQALEALGPADARAVLDAKLPFMGPLENLSPGAAEELLALADLAGAPDVREAITAALKRPRVPDPERDRLFADLRDMAASAGDIFGPGVRVEVRWPPGDEEIPAPVAGRRRTPKIRDRLLGELRGSSLEVRRLAASALGAWSGDEAVVAALRFALDDGDDYTRACAVRSLGHLGDADEGVWERALEIAASTELAPTEVAEAVVLLARLDEATRRDPGESAVAGLCLRFPADTRRLAGLASLLAPARA